MIFRKSAARLAPATGLNEAAFATITPHRRLIAAWRRDEDTGRLKIVWKLIDIQDKRRGA
jgi:hypothetical protein